MSISIFSVHFPLRVESLTQWSNPQNDFQHHSLLVVVAISVVVVVVVLFAVAALLYFVFLRENCSRLAGLWWSIAKLPARRSADLPGLQAALVGHPPETGQKRRGG